MLIECVCKIYTGHTRWWWPAPCPATGASADNLRYEVADMTCFGTLRVARHGPLWSSAHATYVSGIRAGSDAPARPCVPSMPRWSCQSQNAPYMDRIMALRWRRPMRGVHAVRNQIHGFAGSLPTPEGLSCSWHWPLPAGMQHHRRPPAGIRRRLAEHALCLACQILGDPPTSSPRM